MTRCLANWTPEVPGQEPLPITKAPPWIHTMTGSFAPGAAPAGRHTLTNRQSSEDVGEIPAESGGKAACGQSAPNVVASRSPCHATTGCVGRQRYSPTGAPAYGIPLKLDTSPSVTPRTTPEAVRTVGPTPEAVRSVACAEATPRYGTTTAFSRPTRMMAWSP